MKIERLTRDEKAETVAVLVAAFYDYPKWDVEYKRMANSSIENKLCQIAA